MEQKGNSQAIRHLCHWLTCSATLLTCVLAPRARDVHHAVPFLRRSSRGDLQGDRGQGDGRVRTGKPAPTRSKPWSGRAETNQTGSHRTCHETESKSPTMAKQKFERTKPHVNIGTMGHIDHARPLYRGDHQGPLRTHPWHRLHALRPDRQAPEERQRGITISIAHVEYETANRHYATSTCLVTPTT